MIPWYHRSLYNKFRAQKVGANRRDIAWQLTFEEWMEIWQSSGHLAERGRKQNQYVMARKGDVGSYCKSNVQIILHADNIREGRALYLDGGKKARRSQCLQAKQDYWIKQWREIKKTLGAARENKS